MKQFVLVALLLMPFLPAAFSAEPITLEPIPVTQIEGDISYPLPRTIPTFTKGRDETNQLPYLISAPKSIRYPRWAIQQGWQGRLVLAVEVKANGSVGRYKVMESTGHSMLDKAAIRSVQTWKFNPAMKNGKPAVECIQIPVIFNLGENP